MNQSLDGRAVRRAWALLFGALATAFAGSMAAVNPGLVAAASVGMLSVAAVLGWRTKEYMGGRVVFLLAVSLMIVSLAVNCLIIMLS